ncbi:MAG: hypothetical protein ABI472_08910 [Ginsengibacter sp.]
MWIADTGNKRIVYFKNIPAENNLPANKIYGNINFESIGEHLEVGSQHSERMYWPFAVNVMDDQLIVADTGNHRIIFYTI